MKLYILAGKWPGTVLPQRLYCNLFLKAITLLHLMKTSKHECDESRQCVQQTWEENMSAAKLHKLPPL